MSLRRSELSHMSKKQRAKLAALGVAYPFSTFAPKEPKAAKRQAHTGPTRSVTELVDKRSGGMCEWPGCCEAAIHRHHRLNRKFGGRHGEMQERINEAHWILHACLVHHAYVTSPHGYRRRNAIAMGWLLLEGQDAAKCPVRTRHEVDPVWLLPTGRYLQYEEMAA